MSATRVPGKVFRCARGGVQASIPFPFPFRPLSSCSHPTTTTTSISPIWLGARIAHLGAARSSAHTLKPEIFLTTHQRHFFALGLGYVM